MNHHSNYSPLALFLLLLLAVGGASLVINQPPPASPVAASPEQTTPELIQNALDAGRLDRATADTYLAYALADPSQLPAEFHSQQAWDGTLALLNLTVADSADGHTAVADLSPTRQAIQTTLTGGQCGPAQGTLPHLYITPHFHIEYDTIGGGLTIETYAAVLETSYDTLITQYGWAAPPTHPALDGRYAVRVEPLSLGLYGFISDRGDYAGFVGDNPHTPWPEKYAYQTCMVLQTDYSGFLSEPLAVLQSTVAHELTHAVQHGYGALRNYDLPADMTFVEGTAVMMEDEIFDQANDNYHYLWPEFDSCVAKYEGEPVSSWLIFRGLTERFGTAVAGGGERIIRRIWEANGQGVAPNLPALATALADEGLPLSQAYHDYAIASRFMKSCDAGTGYEAPYCFKEAEAYVAMQGEPVAHGAITAVSDPANAGASVIYNGQVQNNFALNWLDLPAGQGHYQVQLSNTAVSGQLHASVVCDTGTHFRVSPLPHTLQAADVSTLSLINSDLCEQVVLVITNEEITDETTSSCHSNAYTVQITPFDMGNLTEQSFLPLVRSGE